VQLSAALYDDQGRYLRTADETVEPEGRPVTGIVLRFAENLAGA